MLPFQPSASFPLSNPTKYPGKILGIYVIVGTLWLKATEDQAKVT